ncbi:hypothetical protein [Cupriavidus sp. H18C1]|uniref:hypothetical protein n=1 Tax=Cupriavidus sp. H18C1 TaxID=3241601 RepID=UPI003BB852EF
MPGCRHCGASPEAIDTIDCMGAVPLRNVVTVYAPLAPGLAVPAIIGEVELCPGLIEEVRIDAEDEHAVPPGTPVRPVWIDDEHGGGWVFRAATTAAASVKGDVR